MNFHVGQDVVCVETFGSTTIVKDKTYTVEGIRKTACACNTIDLNVGTRLRFASGTKCGICGVWVEENWVAWNDQRCFRPLDELADISELTEHLENTTAFEQ